MPGFPETVADLRGGSGNFRGSPGNFRQSLGNLRGSSGLLLKSTVREAPGSRQGISGEVPGNSGKSRDFPEARGSLTQPHATKNVSNLEEAPMRGEIGTLLVIARTESQARSKKCGPQLPRQDS